MTRTPKAAPARKRSKAATLKNTGAKASPRASKPKKVKLPPFSYEELASPSPAPMGRPSSYSVEIADEICLRLASGKSLKAICDDDKMPGRSTVFRWLGDRERSDFRDSYARARELQADTLVDEIIAIADAPSMGTRKTVKGAPSREPGGAMTPQSVEVVTVDMVERSKLMIETRKWAAAKMAPKKYGERSAVELSGPNGGPIQHADLSNVSDDDLDLLEQIAERAAAAPAGGVQS